MTRQQAAVARLTASRGRLRQALVGASGADGPQSLLGTLVRDHPLVAAALAVLVGGLAVRLRPWRWLAKPGLWMALLPQVVSTLAQAPLGTWAEALMALLRRSEPAESAEPAEPAAGAMGPPAPPEVPPEARSQAQAPVPSPAPPPAPSPAPPLVPPLAQP